MRGSLVEPRPSRLESIEAIVSRALEEDAADRDLTTRAVVPAQARARGRVVARGDGVLAGCAYASAAFRACDPGVSLEWRWGDGDRVAPGDEVLACEGDARALLAAERTALNFLQQLSGVATATARLVREAAEVPVLDTRKTVPGLRDAQRAAVRAGGGRNHRRDLADQLLLKRNHFALSGLDHRATIRRARAAAAGKALGVEARNAREALRALEEGADYVLLDNFTPGRLARAVARIRRRFPGAVLEASGGVTLRNVAKLRLAGASRVSCGAVTHSAPALDLAFCLEPLPKGPREPASGGRAGGGP